jgi:hypothetical protein
VLEFEGSLSLAFGFLGLAPGSELCFPRSLGRSMSFFPMLSGLFALLLQLPRPAGGRPVDRSGDHDDSDNNKHDDPCVHEDLSFSIDLPYPARSLLNNSRSPQGDPDCGSATVLVKAAARFSPKEASTSSTELVEERFYILIG